MQRDMAGVAATLAFAPELSVIRFYLGVVEASRVSSRWAYCRSSIAGCLGVRARRSYMRAKSRGEGEQR